MRVVQSSVLGWVVVFRGGPGLLLDRLGLLHGRRLLFVVAPA